MLQQRGAVTLAAMSTTETISQHYRGLDAWDDAAILAAFVEGQELAIAAAARAIVGRLFIHAFIYKAR